MQAGMRRRRGLTLRQAVHLVVHDDQRDVDVADHGVHEMLHADGISIAVAAEVDYLEARVRDRDAHRHRQ